MLSKINILSIVVDHFNTLTNNKSGKIYIPDLIVFFCAPLVISGLLLFKGSVISNQLANVLVTSFSIFAALLFNLLLLVFDIADKYKPKNRSDEDLIDLESKNFKKVLREIYINVSFCILVSILSIILLIGFFIDYNAKLFLLFLSFIVYFLVFVFLLTLFMILKRVYTLLSKRMKDIL
jgi:high-affinity Fe2+/Pb2+ permease